MSLHLAMPMWLPMPAYDQYSALQMQLQALAFSADVLAAQMQVCPLLSRVVLSAESHRARLAQLQRRAAAAQRRQEEQVAAEREQARQRQQQWKEEKKRREKEKRDAARNLRRASLPSHWDGDSSKPRLITLDEMNPAHAKELRQVTRHFHGGAGGVMKVTRVQRVQNPVLYRAYESKKAEMRESHQSHQADLLVYHGTRWNSPQTIIENGFDVARGVCKIGHLWFASKSQYSAHFANINSRGESQILCVRICPFAHERVDDRNGSRIYTVGNSWRMLPTHLITFRSTSLW